jgi:hypothetical protein
VNIKQSLNRRSAAAGLATIVGGGFLTSRLGLAQTPEASPADASPEASPVAFPEGPLGEQLLWLEDALNSEGGPTVEEVESHLAPGAADLAPAEEIAATITELGAVGGPYAIDWNSMIMTMDFPPTHASFTINGETGGTLQGGITIDRDTGLIGGFGLESADATPEASPEGTPLG